MKTHWHCGHNVSGYLPESDEPNTYEDWSDALSSLVADIEWAWDDGTDEQYLDAHCAMHNATSGHDFLTYTTTHLDSAHDIPTAWWVESCQDSKCEPWLN